MLTAKQQQWNPTLRVLLSVLFWAHGVSYVIAGNAQTTSLPEYAESTHQNFLFGVDLSDLARLRQCGHEFIGTKKQEVEGAQGALRDSGANLAKFTVLNNPQWDTHYTFDIVLSSLLDAKQKNYKTLLALHYSDELATYESHVLPTKWKGLDAEALKMRVYSYTFETLWKAYQKGALPDIVQIGHTASIPILREAAIEERINWQRQADLLNSAISAVKDVRAVVNQSLKILLAVNRAEDLEWWMEEANAGGVSGYDMVGVAYYPAWSGLSVRELAKVLSYNRHLYSKEFLVTDTAYPWTMRHDDKRLNVLGKKTLIDRYRATPKGQYKYLHDLSEALISSGATGLIYGHPVSVSSDCERRWGKGSEWENASLFNYKRPHRLISSVAFMQDDYVMPYAVNFEFVPGERLTQEVLYFWSDFFGSNNFLAELPKANGRFTYSARLMNGDRFTYRLFADRNATIPLLIEGALGDDEVEIVVSGNMSVTHSINNLRTARK